MQSKNKTAMAREHHDFCWFFGWVQSIYINRFFYFSSHIVGISINKNRFFPSNLMFFVLFQMAINSIIFVLVFHISLVLVFPVLELLACFPNIFHSTSLAADDIVYIFFIFLFCRWFQFAKFCFQCLSFLHDKTNS